MYNQPCPCAVHAFIKHMFLYDRANECFDLMRIFSRGGGGGIKLIQCKKIVFFVYREERKEDSLIFCSADDDRDETI